MGLDKKLNCCESKPFRAPKFVARIGLKLSQSSQDYYELHQSKMLRAAAVSAVVASAAGAGPSARQGAHAVSDVPLAQAVMCAPGTAPCDVTSLVVTFA
jgi:hypothetical protein